MTGILLVITFLVLGLIGVPIAYAMGLSTIVALLVLDVPIALFFTRTIASINSSSLLAIPFFIVAGDILTVGGISRRLIAFANASLGWARGGLGMVNVAGSILFAGVSGSAAADTVAVGGVMIPAMKRSGYDPAFAVAVTAASSTLGPIIPPSVLLIIYGGITGVSIGALFVAGIIPGLFLGLTMLTMAWWIGRKQVGRQGDFEIMRVLRALRKAFLGIVLPVGLIAGILGGVFTATEGGVVIVVYALIVSALVYRELTPREMLGVMLRSTVMTGVLMLLVAMAAGFAWILAYTRVPSTILTALTALTENRTVLMLIIVGFLLALGMFVETIAATIITVPVLFPLGEAVGFDPLHFALVIVMTLLIGTITPPLGILLYISAGIGGVSIPQAIRASMPWILLLVGTVVVVALVEPIATWLPGLIG
jgi:tripartite ATP-independent transporter DctM subunit